MTTINYTGPNNGLFNDPANWSTDTVPGAGDDAIISGDRVVLNRNLTVGSLTLSGDAHLNVSAHTLTTDGLDVGSGSGVLLIKGNVAGSSTVAAGGIIQAGKLGGSVGAVENNGHLVASGGTLSLGSITGTGELLIEGKGVVTAGAATGQTVLFTNNSTGTLALTDPGNFEPGNWVGQIKGFSRSGKNAIDLIDKPPADVGGAIQQGRGGAALALVGPGDIWQAQWSLPGATTYTEKVKFADDTHGGTLVTFVASMASFEPAPASSSSGALVRSQEHPMLLGAGKA